MSGIAAAPPVRWRSEAKEIGGFYTFLKSEVDKLKAAEGNIRTHAMKQCDVLLKEYVSFNPYIQRLYFEHQRKKIYGDSRYPQAYRYSIARPRFPSVWDSSPAAVKRSSVASRQSMSSYRSESSSEPTNAKIMTRTPKPERGRNQSPATAEYRSDTRNPERPSGSRRSPELIRYRSPDSYPERARQESPYKISEGSPYKYRRGNQYEGGFSEATDKTLPSQRSYLDRSTYDKADRAEESGSGFVSGQQQEPQQPSYTARHQASIAFGGQTGSLARVRSADARTDLRSCSVTTPRIEDPRIDSHSSSDLRTNGGGDFKQGNESWSRVSAKPFSGETSGLPMTYGDNYSSKQPSVSCRLHHGCPGVSYMPGGTALYQDEGTQTPQAPGYSHRMAQGDPPPHRSDPIDTSSSSSQGTTRALESSSSRHASPPKLPIGGIYSYKVPAGGSYRMPDLSSKLPEARLAEGNVYIISDGNQYRTSEGRTLEHVQVGHLLYGNQDRMPEPEKNRAKTQRRRKKFAPHRCDVKELIPEQRPMKRKYIQNKVPETRKYTFYKYYGFAGQGAKTSWAHNRPLGLSPPHAQRGAPQLEPETLQ